MVNPRGSQASDGWDVWSLGLVGFEPFFRPRGARENPDLSTEKIHQLRITYLRESRLPVAPLLQRMLSWNVESGPSMAEVAS